MFDLSILQTSPLPSMGERVGVGSFLRPWVPRLRKRDPAHQLAGNQPSAFFRHQTPPPSIDIFEFARWGVIGSMGGGGWTPPPTGVN